MWSKLLEAVVADEKSRGSGNQSFDGMCSNCATSPQLTVSRSPTIGQAFVVTLQQHYVSLDQYINMQWFFDRNRPYDRQ